MNNYINQLFKSAVSAHQEKNWIIAKNLYKQILTEIPNQPDALHLLGLCLSEENKFESAIKNIQKAIEQVPNNPVFHSNLGEVFRRAGHKESALFHFTKALQLKPDFAEAKFNLANILNQSGQIEQAIALLKDVVQAVPNHGKAWLNLGTSFINNGQFKSAIETLQHTIQLIPQSAEAHNNLGIALQEWDRIEEAKTHFKEALRLQPSLESAILNLSGLYDKTGNVEKAREIYQHKSSFQNAQWDAVLYEKTFSPIIESSNESIDHYRSQLLQAIPKNVLKKEDLSTLSSIELSSLSHLIYQGRNDKEIKKSYATIFENVIPPLAAKEGTSPFHIGFVVTSGHEGVFIKCMRGILNKIDSRFNLTVICNAPNGEKILRPVIENNAVKFLSIPQDINKAVTLIQEAGFDLLYYWEVGTDKLNYLLPFFRLAKVQCTSWGWPTTSGIPNLDYFISTHSLEPLDGDKHYSETLIKLHRLPIYYYSPPIPNSLKPRSAYAWDENKNYYFCQQNLRKVHPDFDVLVLGILEKDPNGFVVFIHDKFESVTQLLKNRLSNTCASVYDRILFMHRMEESEYLNVLSLADVALDTLHYGGGANTCYDAFACGTPLVTLPGAFHRGRFAYAAYQQINVSHCIASDKNQYIECAVDIATNKQVRKNISTEILEKSKFLFEDLDAVKELENSFENLITK